MASYTIILWSLGKIWRELTNPYYGRTNKDFNIVHVAGCAADLREDTIVTTS